MLLHEFIEFVRQNVTHELEVHHGFISFEQDGRTFIIDATDGSLYAHPTIPSKHLMARIEGEQCQYCYNRTNVEAAVSCIFLRMQGYLQPSRICVVTDFDADRKMHQIQDANATRGNADFSPVQLKIISMLFAFHEGVVPPDVQEKIDVVPTNRLLETSLCPHFSERVQAERRLIERNISRYTRKGRFLDVLRDMQYLSTSYHSIGMTYINRRLSDLQHQLSSIGSNQ